MKLVNTLVALALSFAAVSYQAFADDPTDGRRPSEQGEGLPGY